MTNKELASQLNNRLADSTVLVDELMKNHTSFQIGGPADLLILPHSIDDVVAAYRYLKTLDIPITWIGNGSNLLVSDAGIRGAVIKLAENLSDITVDGQRLIAAGGALLRDVSRIAAENSLTGFEFACGIPGTIGGATFMNAGAYDGEMAQVVAAVTILDQSGQILRLTKEQLTFCYRGSNVQDNGYIVLEVELQLTEGDKSTIAATVADLMARREAKQPLELPSAGSTFKRPPGYYAGKLIQDSGLRGVRFGDAAVSEKHCGFVVNLGEATCRDVITLIHFIEKTVFDNFGVKMQTEVRKIGQGF